MGLIKAADGFDEKRGLKFSTYAVPVILGEIRRLFRDGGAVKVSRSLKEMSMRASREREDFISREGREPTVSEMADLLGVGIEQAAEALSAAMPALSLTKAGEDEGEQLDVPVEPPDELLTDKLALHQVLCELDSLDRALIVLRYLKSNTQQATAEKLGMTQVQVSRRERAILEIMRRKLTG
jgi:RNA polymerase sporulation-specific sigma factor